MPTQARLHLLKFRIKQLVVRDFSGGPNVREAPPELAENESVDSWNVTFDERGGVGARTGYVKYNPSAYSAGLVQNLFYSGVAQSVIVQAGASLYKGTSTSAVKTFSTSARVGFADFAGKVCAIHPVDGLWTSSDGTTWALAITKGTVTVTIASPAVFTFTAHGLAAGDPVTFSTTGALPTGLTAGTVYYVISAGLTADQFEVSTTVGGAAVNTSGSQSGTHTLAWGNSPLGNCIYPWQNKLWAAGNPTNPSRVQWSAAANPGKWVLTDFNDIREKDNEQVVALAGASGIDVQGRPGLLAFKRASTYRIFSSTTGEYSTVDTTVGAASAISVVSVGEKTMALSQKGLYWTNGVGPMVEATSRFQPLWDPAQVNFGLLDNFCAGRRYNRAHFSLPRAGSTANDFAFEYHPDQGWSAPGSHAMACYTSYGLSSEVLVGASPTVSGQTYQMYNGGSDDGAAISSRFQTRWYEVSGGFLAQLWAVRLQLRGAFNLGLRKDFQSTDFNNVPVTADPPGPFYDSFFYDAGVSYANPGSQVTVAQFGYGVIRQFSLRITASTTNTMNAQTLFGQGTAPVNGAWALYGVSALYIPLGWA